MIYLKNAQMAPLKLFEHFTLKTFNFHLYFSFFVHFPTCFHKQINSLSSKYIDLHN